MMLHMANFLIELYLPEYEQCMSSSGDKLFTDMIRRRDRELRSMEMKLQGARYLVLTCRRFGQSTCQHPVFHSFISPDSSLYYNISPICH